jgi:hypothetical protein
MDRVARPAPELPARALHGRELHGEDDMSEDAMKKMVQGMLESLERDGAAMDGLKLDDLRDAMSHPEVPRFLAEWMPIEAASVAQGADAPDFRLPFLPGQGREAGETVTLSDHFGNRPVGLIFGSYT